MDTTESRKVSTKVPLIQVPYIMRALGFYPTEQEVGELSTTFFSPATFILFIGVVTKYITKTCLHYTFWTYTYNCIIIPNLSIITKYYLSESELFLEMEQP